MSVEMPKDKKNKLFPYGIEHREVIGYSTDGERTPIYRVKRILPPEKKFNLKSDISLLSAQATAEGPFYKGAWLISGRRTYFDVLLPKILPANIASRIPPYFFYDIQSHIYSDITPKDRVSISFYNGIDDLLFDTFGLTGRWGNNTLSMQYRRVFSEKLIGNFSLPTFLYHNCLAQKLFALE